FPQRHPKFPRTHSRIDDLRVPDDLGEWVSLARGPSVRQRLSAAAPQHCTWMLSSGSTVMLFIVFPPQGASLRTSFAVLRSVAGFAGARGAAGACATAGGAGSGRVAIWVGGGAGGVYGTGAGPASTVSGA